jgi:hypothetical protein
MTHRNTLERWEIKVRNCEVTLQVLWPVAKLLMKKDGPKAPTAVLDPLGITYHSNKKANAIADCIKNHFTSHDLYDENHE